MKCFNIETLTEYDDNYRLAPGLFGKRKIFHNFQKKII